MDKEKIELVKAWLSKAQHDLISVRKLVAGDDPVWDTAIFHCQQAAEKALKGFLVFHDIRFRKIHNIKKLIEWCQGIDEQFRQWLYAADILTPYVTASRYPDEPFDLDQKQLEEALELAQKIYDFVLTKLPAEAQP
jgi:HEPN domain-containing protein